MELLKTLILAIAITAMAWATAWEIDQRASEKAQSIIMNDYQTSISEDARDQAMQAIVDSYKEK